MQNAANGTNPQRVSQRWAALPAAPGGLGLHGVGEMQGRAPAHGLALGLALFSSSILQNDRRSDRAHLGKKADPPIVGDNKEQ